MDGGALVVHQETGGLVPAHAHQAVIVREQVG
jgi:hypothetical protein